MHKPILGILGGVGPLATAYFMELLIKKTPAQTDQENMPMIVFNDPQIPDRTAYILDHSQSNPQGEMVKVARWLEEAGSDYIAIACNTAHYFYDAINEAVTVPVVNIMEETASRIATLAHPGAKVGLMATEGTVESGVFQSYFEHAGLSTLAPDHEDQDKVTHLIYGCVKANQPYDPQEFLSVAASLHDAGCEAVVVGCTELSVIYQDLDERPEWLFDSLDILADRCVQIYLNARAKDGQIEM